MLRATIIALLGLTVVGTALAADVRQATHIPPQELETALQALAKERELQIIFRSTLVKEMRTAGVSGDLTPNEALARLLAGTGMTFRYLDEKTVTIVPAAPKGAPSQPDAVSAIAPVAADSGGLRLAQAETGAQEKSPEDPAAAAQPLVLEEVVVTGSRLRRPGNAGPAPVTVFDRERIEQLGVSSVANVFDYLPQQSFVSREGTTNGGSRTVRLRGLGLGTTLILVNGRRTVTSALQGSGNFFDLNTVPLAAVERIEVLSDSASAVYGADAVGGVVNIILRGTVNEPSVDLYYGAADGGADERRGALSLGLSRERFHGSAVFDFFDRGFLEGTERERFNNQDFTRFGGTDMRLPFSNPGNVFSASGGNLPGISAPFAAVPQGNGVGLTPADFAATAGQTNLESVLKHQSIVPRGRQYSGLATMEFTATENLTVFGDFLYTDQRTESLGFPNLLAFQFVPDTNPFNPFGEPVFVNYLLTEIPPRAIAKTESARGVLGLRAQFGNWDGELAALVTDETGSSRLTGNLDQVAIDTALAATDPDEALNLFGTRSAGSRALLASITADPSVTRDSSKAAQLGGFVRGPIAQLPGGALDFVVGAEARKEKLHFEDSIFSAPLSRDRDTSAVYSEIRAPLVSPSMEVAGAERIALTVAGRFDHYSDFGGTFNPQYGLEWQPVGSLLLRASYGTSFRAPSLYELYVPAGVNNTALPDPRRGDEVSPLSITTGGNANLDPEESDSFSAGFVYTPQTAYGLRIAATYWRIQQDQRVQPLAGNLILANEDRFPDRIEREEPTDEDIAAGFPGRLVRIDGSNINFGALETDGVDLQLSSIFDTRLGKFSPTLDLTRIQSYKVADFPNTPSIERVGVGNLIAGGTIPRLRATAGLAWSRGVTTLSSNARYVSSYDDADFFGNRNGREVSSQTLIDVQGSFDFSKLKNGGAGYLENVVVRAGITNVFDKKPPFAVVGGLSGFDLTQGDLRQRFGYVSVSKTF